MFILLTCPRMETDFLRRHQTFNTIEKKERFSSEELGERNDLLKKEKKNDVRKIFEATETREENRL